MKTTNLSPRDLATVLAALRCLQQVLAECGGDLPDDLLNIATDGDSFERLETDEIDDLCERINGVVNGVTTGVTGTDSPKPADGKPPSPKNGDRYRNLRPELDMDQEGADRVTPAGNVWVVHLAGTPNRWIGCQATGAAICPDDLELQRDFERIVDTDRRDELIRSLPMPALVGNYASPKDVPEWAWVERNASFSHWENGQGSVLEFVVNLANELDDIPPKLEPAIAAARSAGMGYLLFFQD